MSDDPWQKSIASHSSESDPWTWLRAILTPQKRDWLAYLTLVASCWTLVVRIEDLKNQPDRAAAVGTMILLVAMGILAWTEILDEKIFIDRRLREIYIPFDVPARIALYLAVFCIIVQLAFFKGESRIRGFLGAAPTTLVFMALSGLASKISGERKYDSGTILALCLSGLILGCGFTSFVALPFLWALLSLPVYLVESLAYRFGSKPRRLGMRRVILDQAGIMTVVPILLATSILLLPRVSEELAKFRQLVAEDETRATEIALGDLQKANFSGLSIEPVVRQHLQQHYATNNPKLLLTFRRGNTKDEIAFREENAHFIFVAKRQSTTAPFKIVSIYERDCWCDF